MASRASALVSASSPRSGPRVRDVGQEKVLSAVLDCNMVTQYLGKSILALGRDLGRVFNFNLASGPDFSLALRIIQEDNRERRPG